MSPCKSLKGIPIFWIWNEMTRSLKLREYDKAGKWESLKPLKINRGF